MSGSKVIHLIRRKMNDSSGETLAEVLVASLVAGAALLGLATMIMVSHKMMDTSGSDRSTYYEHVNGIELRAMPKSSAVVTIKDNEYGNTEITVDLYKSEDNLLAVYD